MDANTVTAICATGIAVASLAVPVTIYGHRQAVESVAPWEGRATWDRRRSQRSRDADPKLRTDLPTDRPTT